MEHKWMLPRDIFMCEERQGNSIHDMGLDNIFNPGNRTTTTTTYSSLMVTRTAN
jgi:hypothetical protein